MVDKVENCLMLYGNGSKVRVLRLSWCSVRTILRRCLCLV